MPTPESKVKRKVSTLLGRYKAHYWMPVPCGYGRQHLDYICCYNGLYFAIETKSPVGKVTPRQDKTMREIRAAGGITFVIRDDKGIEELEKWLKALRITKQDSEQ